jgi:hypothetical protein
VTPRPLHCWRAIITVVEAPWMMRTVQEAMNRATIPSTRRWRPGHQSPVLRVRKRCPDLFDAARRATYTLGIAGRLSTAVTYGVDCRHEWGR